MMSNFDKQRVGEILAGEGTWFGAHLFRLIAKADEDNRAKLYSVFPLEVETVHKHLTGKQFFKNENENS